MKRRNWVQKLKDRRALVRVKDITDQVLPEKDRRRSTRPASDTPRTDSFVAIMPPLVLDPADLADRNALLRVTIQIREHMLGWAAFARQLERELNQSIPQEWRQSITGGRNE